MSIPQIDKIVKDVVLQHADDEIVGIATIILTKNGDIRRTRAYSEASIFHMFAGAELLKEEIKEGIVKGMVKKIELKDK